MDRLDALNAIVHCTREGLTYGAIINTLGVPIDVRKGTQFGTINSTCSNTDLGHFSGRIATLCTTLDLTGPQRRKADREGYIKAFLSRSPKEVTGGIFYSNILPLDVAPLTASTFSPVNLYVHQLLSPLHNHNIRMLFFSKQLHHNCRFPCNSSCHTDKY
jgi:hypothetical protein